MPRARDILEAKGTAVATIAASACAQDAVLLMHERHIGSVVVLEGEKIVGIFTERDVMNRLVAVDKNPRESTVREVMTPRVAFCELDTPLSQCHTAMTQNRIRHLPVLSEGRLAGIVSIGDIVARELQDSAEQIRYLHEYMHETVR